MGGFSEKKMEEGYMYRKVIALSMHFFIIYIIVKLGQGTFSDTNVNNFMKKGV